MLALTKYFIYRFSLQLDHIFFRHFFRATFDKYFQCRKNGLSFPDSCMGIFLHHSLSAVRPLVNIRFGVLRNNQIGHVIQEGEYILYKSFGQKRNFPYKINLFGSLRPISNNFLHNKYASKLNYSSSYDRFIKILNKVPGGWRNLCFYHINPIMDICYNGLFPGSPRICFSRYENEGFDKIISSFGLRSGKYVCFHIRDSAHYKRNKIFESQGGKIKPGGDLFSFRNADINILLPAINWITDQNIRAVRMGSIAAERLEGENRYILDYANSEKRSDVCDLALIKNCLYFIGMHTGLTLVPVLLNRPILWINSFWRGIHYTLNNSDLFIPKKLWLGDKKRFATFQEMRILGAPPGNIISEYLNRGIEIIDSSFEEIKLAVQEMHKKISGSWEDEKNDDRELEKKYRNIVWSDFEFIDSGYSKPAITFLRSNRDMLLPNPRSGTTYFLKPLDCINRHKNCNISINQTLKSGSRDFDWESFMRSGWLKVPYALAVSKSSCPLIRFKVNYVRYSIALMFNVEPVKSIAYILNKNMKLKLKINNRWSSSFSLYNRNNFYVQIPDLTVSNFQYLNIKFNLYGIGLKQIILHNIKLTNINYTHMEQINVLKFDETSEIYNFWEVVY